MRREVFAHSVSESRDHLVTCAGIESSLCRALNAFWEKWRIPRNDVELFVRQRRKQVALPAVKTESGTTGVFRGTLDSPRVDIDRSDRRPGSRRVKTNDAGTRAKIEEA